MIGPSAQRPPLAGRAPYAALLLCCLAMTSPGCAALRQGVSNAGIAVSMLRSPLTLETRAWVDVNPPLASSARRGLEAVAASVAVGESRPRALEMHRAAFGAEQEPLLGVLLPFRRHVTDRFDALGDLMSHETVVVVTLSGGGARAARLAAHTLALLEERYEALVRSRPGAASAPPLMSRIDAYSTVSGGSIYAYHVALRHLRDGRLPSDGFRQLVRSRATRAGTRDLGFYTSLGYLAPANLLIPLALTLTTDRGYLDLLAYGLSLSQSPVTRFFWPSDLRLGQLPARPLFLFNTTALETGSPMVLTQRALHLPIDEPPIRSERLDVAVPERPRKPLGHALTLEELNSSPARFPLAYAAVASAAYPVGVEPLPVRRYAYDPDSGQVTRTSDSLRLTDGGVFDNTGLTTAVDLISYLANPPGGGSRVRRVILLSVNAEVLRFDPELTRRTVVDRVRPPLQLDLPLRGLGAQAIDLLHSTNNRNAQDLAWQQLQHVVQDRDLELFYFPVSLMQLSDQDAFPVDGGPSFFERVRQIKTRYTISPAEDALLAQAAATLLRRDQSLGGIRSQLAWALGPSCAAQPGSRRLVGRLDEAFVMALLRAEHGHFEDSGPLVGATAQSLLPCR